MSVYKVPQDVEAEDKLVGPFTFKQLVLLLIAGFIGFIMVMLMRVSIFLAIIPLPVFLVFLFFGVYRRKDQSVETYVSAILRFYFKPRKRIWDKDGILETVIITAPKQVAGIAIDNMNNMEVKNRLKTLGQLMDTRGWSAKNASLQDSGAMAMDLTQSDRLVVPAIQQEPTEIHESDDIMSYAATSATQTIAEKTSTMQQVAKDQAVQKMQQKNPAPHASVRDDDSDEGLPEIHYQGTPTMQQNVIQPLGNNPAPNPPAPQPSASVMTTDVPTDILNLSTNNDRSVESIAKEADKILESGDSISLQGR